MSGGDTLPLIAETRPGLAQRRACEVAVVVYCMAGETDVFGAWLEKVVHVHAV